MDDMPENAGIVVKAFAAVADGDVSLFSPDYTHLGYNIDGRPRVFDGLGPFLELMGRCAAEFEVFDSKWVSVTAIDDELVHSVVAVHRRTRDGEDYQGTILMSFRVEDGIVTRGSDMISSSGEAYWSSLGL